MFDKLAARVADLRRDSEPEWLRTALRGQTPESLSPQLAPTATIVGIPQKLFSELYPGSSGNPLSNRELPKDVRGRIIVIPIRLVHIGYPAALFLKLRVSPAAETPH